MTENGQENDIQKLQDAIGYLNGQIAGLQHICALIVNSGFTSADDRLRFRNLLRSVEVTKPDSTNPMFLKGSKHSASEVARNLIP